MKIITGYTGQAHVTSDDAASLNRAIFGNDRDVILAGIGSELSATISSTGNQVTIGTGDIVMDGVQARIMAAETLTIDNGVQNQYRMDLIVAHYTKNASTAVENVELKVIKGTSGASAVMPEYESGSIADGALVRDAVIYEVVLYGNNIQSLTKAMTTFYSPDVKFMHPIDVQGENGFASFQESEGAKISVSDLQKNELASMKINSDGSVAMSAGAKSWAIPFIQHGFKLCPLSDTKTANVELTFPIAFKTPPSFIPFCTNHKGGAYIETTVVTATDVRFHLVGSNYGSVNVYWVAIGEIG